MQQQVSTCPVCGAPIYVETMYHSIVPPTPTYSCVCRFTRETGYCPQPNTYGAAAPDFNNPPREDLSSNKKAVESLVDCMKKEGILEPSPEERIAHLEKTVEKLTKAVEELAQPKKSCKGACKKTKKVLKD